MNDKDLHNLFRELSDGKASSPIHQKALRTYLLSQHGNQQTFRSRFLGTFGVIDLGVIMKKNISGLSVLGISLLAVGIITFSAMNASPASAAEIAEKAIEKTQHMSAEEIANINNQYKQDLKGRLSEAKHDEDLRVLPASELQSWGWATAKEDPSVKTYLTYTNANSDRIVIGLDSNSEPVFVMNFDNRSESPSNAPTNEDSGTPPPSR